MSELRCFSIIGDSNVRRHLSPSNSSGRPLWSSAKFIPCSRLSLLASSLESVSSESDACVVACVTNFLTSTPPGNVTLRIQAAITGLLDKSAVFARSRPEVQVFVCPPMYRTAPLWYRDGMPHVLATFQSSVRDLVDRPANLWVMPSFAKPILESDGVHLVRSTSRIFSGPVKASSRPLRLILWTGLSVSRIPQPLWRGVLLHWNRTILGST